MAPRARTAVWRHCGNNDLAILHIWAPDHDLQLRTVILAGLQRMQAVPGAQYLRQKRPPSS